MKDHARAARREIEAALDHAAGEGPWPWAPILSGWIDMLLILEAQSA